MHNLLIVKYFGALSGKSAANTVLLYHLVIKNKILVHITVV